MAMNNLGKFCPLWTVPRDIWLAALRPDVSGVAVDARLFHDSGCQLVHKYRVYRDPFPHPALRGRVMNKLLVFVARAMAIAHLTQLHITIPASGSVAEAVPEECFPPVSLPRTLVSSRRVSFASEVIVLGTAPDSLADREPTSLCPPVMPDPVTLPQWFRNRTFRFFLPAGFQLLHLAGGHSGTGRHPFHVDLSTDLPGWFPLWLPDATGNPPSLPVSPIPSDSPASPMVSDPPFGTTGVLDVLLGSAPFDLSASLLEMGPGIWLHSLSWEQAIDAARQLHWDACLITTHLDVLDQYMLCLQGTGRKSWNLVWDPGIFVPKRWLLVPWDPGLAGLQCRWRPMGLGRLSQDPVILP